MVGYFQINIPEMFPYISTLIFFFSVFQIDYEPLDGSVVSIDTTLKDGFVADDLKVLRRPSLHRDETPNGS